MKHIKTVTIATATTNLVDGLQGFLGDAFEQVSSLVKKQGS